LNRQKLSYPLIFLRFFIREPSIAHRDSEAEAILTALQVTAFSGNTPLEPDLVGLNGRSGQVSDITATASITRHRESTMILPFVTLVILSLLGLSCVVAPFLAPVR